MRGRARTPVPYTGAGRWWFARTVALSPVGRARTANRRHAHDSDQDISRGNAFETTADALGRRVHHCHGLSEVVPCRTAEHLWRRSAQLRNTASAGAARGDYAHPRRSATTWLQRDLQLASGNGRHRRKCHPARPWRSGDGCYTRQRDRVSCVDSRNETGQTIA